MLYKLLTKRLCALVVLLFLLGAIYPTEAFVFKLRPDTRRCFSDEITSNSEIRIAYKTSEAPGQELHTALTGDDNRVVWEDNRDEASHIVHIIPGGIYHLCFFSRVNRATREPLADRLITLKLGSDLSDASDADPTRKLKPIEMLLRKIEHTIFGVHNEYLYYKEKEEEMRAANENMTSKLMWISVMVIAIFLVFSYFQLRHLKSYFRKKRMID